MNKVTIYRIHPDKKIMSTRAFIRSLFPKGYKFTLADIFTVCPYTLDELKVKSRKHHLVRWRSLFMVYYFMNGNTLAQAGQKMTRDHSTVLHAIGNVYFARTGVYHELNDMINSAIDCQSFDIEETTDINVNEAISLAHSESKFFERYPELRG